MLLGSEEQGLGNPGLQPQRVVGSLNHREAHISSFACSIILNKSLNNILNDREEVMA